jgi:putative FmdB family regulatory protein
MPRYDYKCTKCDKILEVILLIGEKPQICSEITECSEKAEIIKIFSVPKIFRPDTNDTAGTRVKRFIEDSRHELKEQKKDMTSQEHVVEPNE